MAMEGVSEMRRIHIAFLGRLVKVRFARTGEDLMRRWDLLFPAQVHSETALSYSDLRRLDAHGALDVLPELPLNSERTDTQQAVKATGTDDLRLVPLAPTGVPGGSKRGQILTRWGRLARPLPSTLALT
jgi:hypothetical protein